jgi:hypothetical protein
MHATAATPRGANSNRNRLHTIIDNPLLKSDYPRTIDGYIDYFEGTPRAADETCGEVLFERFA